MKPSIYLYNFLQMKLFIYLSNKLYIYLSIHLPIPLSICLSLYPSLYQSIYLCLSTYGEICTGTRTIYLSIYLSIQVWTDLHWHQDARMKFLHLLHSIMSGQFPPNRDSLLSLIILVRGRGM